jgi:hypothetical protein
LWVCDYLLLGIRRRWHSVGDVIQRDDLGTHVGRDMLLLSGFMDDGENICTAVCAPCPNGFDGNCFGGRSHRD